MIDTSAHFTGQCLQSWCLPSLSLLEEEDDDDDDDDDDIEILSNNKLLNSTTLYMFTQKYVSLNSMRGLHTNRIWV